MAGAGRELELKYAVENPDAVREFVGADTLAGFRAGPWRTLEISDRYVDTYSRRLAKAGYGARLRRVDGRTTLTVKADSRASNDANDALHDRLELEAPATRTLDPQDWPPSEARSAVEATIGRERLRTLFTIRQRRVERDLRNGEGPVVATLSIDDAAINRLGRRLGSFTTLEIEAANEELRSPGALARLARELEATALLRPEPRSKLEIGLGMVGAAVRPLPRPPATPGVAVDDTMREAGRKVLRQHLLRMLTAESGAFSGNVEGVHKMRVATRRMRAAWRVFDGAFKPKLQRRYVAELRVVARSLGAVRDLDVQIERLATYAGGAGGHTDVDLEPLVNDWLTRRAHAHEALADQIDSAAYERFVSDYRGFVEASDTRTAAGDSRVRDEAGGRIWRAYERVRAHDEVIPGADAAQLHQLRIDGKRLRYTLEFFREILPPSVDPLIAELTAQQDHLGLLNDAQVAATLTRTWLLELAPDVPGETRSAATAYLAASESEQTRLHRSFGRMWRRVVGRSFRRNLALAISEI